MKRFRLLTFLFVVIFLAGSYYIGYMRTEKYESQGIIAIKDLSNKQKLSSLGSVLLGQGDISTKQDSELLTVYIRSHEMFDDIDHEFNLSRYYTSNAIDFAQRLRSDSFIPFLDADYENFIRNYRGDLRVNYDDLSGTLSIGFFHADPQLAKQVSEKIIRRSTEVLNDIDKENAEILVDFLQKQEQKYKKRYVDSIQDIISFQNKSGIVDPNIDIRAKSELLAQLQGQLVKAQIDYRTKRTRLTVKSPIIKSLSAQIVQLKKHINDIENSLSGKQNNKTNSKLNQDQFSFEILKKELSFNAELYKQTLFKLEDARISANQNAKNLITLSAPVVPQHYARPDKLKEILSLGIVLLFLYGIIRTSLTLLREHKD